jgi:hypothetical protein
MIKRWLKPCPRCRGNHLLEATDGHRRLVRCMQCGYLLLKSETRFLYEETLRQTAATVDRTAA